MKETITKEMIVGARIIDIHEDYELTDGGLDQCIIYFTVDRGFSFTVPDVGYPWKSADIPESAQRLKDQLVSYSYKVKKGIFGKLKFEEEPSTVVDTVKQIKEKVIAGVYCGPYDEELEFHDPQYGTIVFEDGSRVSNNMVSPHGTGDAGLCFRLGKERNDEYELVDYFSIPMRK